MGVARLAIATLLLLLAPPTRSLRSPSSLSSGYLEFSRDDFPQSFVFGAGTSAYQAEGAADEDGRSPSVWDTFTHAGLMDDGSTADVSADAYHKYKEDVKLMNETGLEAYRFSISWSRLIPNGRGAVNPKGLEYYNNLINELVKHGIQPHVTLFHSDLPQVLEDEYSGWLSPRIVNDFVAYVDVCFREFGDRVSHWTTVNEPNIYAVAAYDDGLWPPRRCSPPFGMFNCSEGNSTVEPYVVIHHVLLAHAAVVELYRTKYQAVQRGCVGINVFSYAFSPLTDSAADAEATKRAKDFVMGWIIEPLVSGDYPNVMKKNAGSRIPSFTERQKKQLKGAFDFFGLNHYLSSYVTDNPDYPKGLSDYNRDIRLKYARRKNDTPSAWLPPATPVPDPPGLQRALEYLKQEYGNPPIYIQETGFATPKSVTINDTKRIDVLKGYIGAILAAMRSDSGKVSLDEMESKFRQEWLILLHSMVQVTEKPKESYGMRRLTNAAAACFRNGSNARGYFVWSFMDVFELLTGYQTTLGLYHVDFEDEDRKRQAKLSALWYRDFLSRGKQHMAS